MGNVTLCRRRRGLYDRLEEDSALGREEPRQQTEGRKLDQVDRQVTISRAVQLHHKKERQLRRNENRWRRQQRRRSRMLRRRYERDKNRAGTADGAWSGVYSVNLLSPRSSGFPPKRRSFDDSYSVYYEKMAPEPKTETITDHSSNSCSVYYDETITDHSSGSSGSSDDSGVVDDDEDEDTIEKFRTLLASKAASPPLKKHKTGKTATVWDNWPDLSIIRAMHRLSSLTEGSNSFEANFGNQEWAAHHGVIAADFGNLYWGVPVNHFVWL